MIFSGLRRLGCLLAGARGRGRAWRVALGMVLCALVGAAPASANVSFTSDWGWGVLDGQNQFEKCTTTCQRGIAGGGAGQLFFPASVAVDRSGHVFVGDYEEARVDEFSSAGRFIRAWGWGVLDGKSQLETCSTTCHSGVRSGGAGGLSNPDGIAVDGSGDVFVADFFDLRVDEFAVASSQVTFTKAWGWGVLDGKSQLETCTTNCEAGVPGAVGAGALEAPAGIAVDGSGDVFVADAREDRINEFSVASTPVSFTRAWGWGVLDGQSQFETCTTTCQSGVAGGGAGQFADSEGVALDGSADIFVADEFNNRVDEFSVASSQVTFTKASGWGVLDGKSQLETCTTATACQSGVKGGGAGELGGPDTGAGDFPNGVAVDGFGDVFVADNGNDRIDEFSPTGAFAAWGWGVLDGKSQFERCTTTCRSGVGGSGAGALLEPNGVAVDGSGDVFAIDQYNSRVDEFGIKFALNVSLAGAGSGSVASSPAGISCPGTCSHSYPSGTMVTLTASPATGSAFSGWTGGGCSGTGTCTIAMSSAKAITATFNLG